MSAAMTQSSTQSGELKRFLRPIHLWAIAVGLVISGDYFGWNYGLAKGGPVGMMIATLVVTAMYVCFIFSYTELSAAIPSSGGPFAFAKRAFGPTGAFIAGFATIVEFVFAPPAIARAIGGYVNFRVPSLSVNAVAIGAFLVFCTMNALGVALAARFELLITVIATFELLLFFGLTGPHVELSQIFSSPMLPFGWAGVFGAIPFAIWFYLALEGVAMSAEETISPKKNIPKGYIAGILTLVTLAMGTLICTTGVMPWQQLVTDDSPLPKALASVLSADHVMTHMMVYLGLFGLVASFHGIIMGYSRQVFALAREGYLPRWLAYISPRFRTPVLAIYLPGMVGVLAVLSNRTDALISLAGMGAIVLYIISMLSLFALRKREPEMERPFVAPMYPYFPAIALILAVVCLIAVAFSDPLIALIFGTMMLAGFGFFRFTVAPRLKREAESLLEVVDSVAGEV